MDESVLVTGCAGFIGMHVCKALIDRGRRVVGVDNMNDYYDVRLKEERLRQIGGPTFRFHKLDISDYEALRGVFERENISQVCNLAAQAGVRYSLENPFAYMQSNVQGFLNLLEILRHHEVKNLVYASSSSVYGGNEKVPFSVDDRVDHPVSLYAATKKTNELFAHTYHHLYGIKSTGLRFFTVYGPWGRPDMAYYKFAMRARRGESIDVYNYGEMERDFTYIDDIVQGVLAAIDNVFDYEIFNLGNSRTEKLGRFIETLERCMGVEMEKNMMPMQPGDVMRTNADIEKSTAMLGFKPTTTIEDGLAAFVRWFDEYHSDDF